MVNPQKPTSSSPCASAVVSARNITQEIYTFKQTRYPSAPKHANIDLPIAEEAGALIHVVRVGNGDNLGEDLLLRAGH